MQSKNAVTYYPTTGYRAGKQRCYQAPQEAVSTCAGTPNACPAVHAAGAAPAPATPPMPAGGGPAAAAGDPAAMSGGSAALGRGGALWMHSASAMLISLPQITSSQLGGSGSAMPVSQCTPLTLAVQQLRHAMCTACGGVVALGPYNIHQPAQDHHLSARRVCGGAYAELGSTHTLT